MISAAPFLFPCIIEYNLIAASIIYRVGSHIGVRPKHVVESSDTDDDVTQNGGHSDHHGVLSYAECEKANKGAFMGLFVVVATAVISIVYIIFTQSDSVANTVIAYATIRAFSVGLLLLMLLAIVVSFVRMTGMRSVQNEDDQTEGTVLFISYVGLMFYQIAILMSTLTWIHEATIDHIFDVIECLLTIAEGTFQTVFILVYLTKRPAIAYHVEEKPARGMVTFLIVCNVALWAVNSFLEKESGANAAEMVYGDIAWVIISNICSPLFIFFRFQSSALLAEIWHVAYT